MKVCCIQSNKVWLHVWTYRLDLSSWVFAKWTLVTYFDSTLQCTRLILFGHLLSQNLSQYLAVGFQLDTIARVDTDWVCNAQSVHRLTLRLTFQSVFFSSSRYGIRVLLEAEMKWGVQWWRMYHQNCIEDEIVPERLYALVHNVKVPWVCILLMERQQCEHHNEAVPIGSQPPDSQHLRMLALKTHSLWVSADYMLQLQKKVKSHSVHLLEWS